jgi:hypothetical protein
MSKLIRHGDVILVPVASAPEDAAKVRRQRGRVVLAEGEVTGHAHVIAEEGVQLVSREEAEELRLWLLVETAEPVALTHEEHATLLIPPGTYEVRRAREYHPEAIRNVVD